MATHTVLVQAIIENKGKFLFIKRSRHEAHMAGVWVFPGGKVKLGEDAHQTLWRELEEETSLQFRPKKMIFLSSYTFSRQDQSSSLGMLYLVHSTNRKLVKDSSIEDELWINPEDIAEYKFTHEPIVDFDSAENKKVTIPGMEVHVRNAVIAQKIGCVTGNLGSVTEYQKRGCTMDRNYLLRIKRLPSNLEAIEAFFSIESNLYPHR